MLSYSDDLEFVDLVVNGDEDAAADFVRQYLPLFIKLAMRAHIPTQDHQDVAQEICLAALGQMKRGLFRGKSRLVTWLAQVAKGKIADYWREQAASGALVTVSLDELDADGALSQTLSAPAEEYDLVVSVREALRELLPLHRGILLLNRSEGRAVEEICGMLSLTKAQVNGRLRQAENEFRGRLRGEEVNHRQLLTVVGESQEN